MIVLSRREFLTTTAVAGFCTQVTGQPVKPETPIKLPAHAVTTGPNHHFFGYYDKTPWDRTGRYLLGMEAAFADRQPKPGERIVVGMVDVMNNNRFIQLGTTEAWCWQQGCMLQWVGSAADRHIVYNIVDEGRPAARIADVLSGKYRHLPLPIYALSPDGTQAVTLDFARLHRLRPGYGYASYTERFADNPAPDTLGIWWMDVNTGKHNLAITLKQLAASKPDARFPGAHHWVNHLQFSPTGKRFVFLHRWKKPDDRTWATRMYTANPDGTDLRLLMDTGMVSHFDWRDDDTLLAWARTKDQGDRFYLLDVNGAPAQQVFSAVINRDGHCSYSPDRKWVLNDTYPDKDRMQQLMLLKVATGRRYDLNTFHSPPQYTGPFRCDLHPRWNRDGTKVCFDGSHGPTRQVYVVDVSEVVRS